MAELEFSRRYAMAHRLLADPASKCAIPHGHNEIVTVRLTPRARFAFGGANALAPFATLKARWHGWIDAHVDHTLMLSEADPLIDYFRDHEPARLARIMTFPGDPTTEALAACFLLKLQAFLAIDDLPFAVGEVRVAETPTNTAMIAPDLLDDGALPRDAWPRRADMSINEFGPRAARPSPG